MKYSKYSVVIIGSGIAGMYSALKLAEHTKLPDGVLVISADDIINLYKKQDHQGPQLCFSR